MNPLDKLPSEQQEAIFKARKRVIETIGKNMDLYGVPLSTGLLYGLMFFQDQPMTLDEMGKAMDMSKTSMSTSVRTLVELKMVHKVWERGSRKDFYEVERDWFQTFSDFFTLKWRKSMEMNLNALRKSVAEMKALLDQYPDDETFRDCVNRDIDKMNEAIRYYLWLGRLIDSFETGKIYEFIPKDPS